MPDATFETERLRRALVVQKTKREAHAKALEEAKRLSTESMLADSEVTAAQAALSSTLINGTPDDAKA